MNLSNKKILILVSVLMVLGFVFLGQSALAETGYNCPDGKAAIVCPGDAFTGKGQNQCCKLDNSDARVKQLCTKCDSQGLKNPNLMLVYASQCVGSCLEPVISCEEGTYAHYESGKVAYCWVPLATQESQCLNRTDLKNPVDGACQDGYTLLDCGEGHDKRCAPVTSNADICNNLLVNFPAKTSGDCPKDASGSAQTKVDCGDGTFKCYGMSTYNNLYTFKQEFQLPCQSIAGGTCESADTPKGLVSRIYMFGLMIVGLLAFGMIVYGGVEYILSAGNIAKTE
ncbi:MAG: hypothetical protein PHP03_02085, partial [Candidatus Pacebacteria bacterium]|nr:hypothetical protein [Candidatus Paceibacterota bacterium]